VRDRREHQRDHREDAREQQQALVRPVPAARCAPREVEQGGRDAEDDDRPHPDRQGDGCPVQREPDRDRHRGGTEREFEGEQPRHAGERLPDAGVGDRLGRGDDAGVSAARDAIDEPEGRLETGEKGVHGWIRP